MNPEISVLMPVYNAEKYLSQAIESVLQQTLSNFEFVIINDGSTDTSLKILQHYAAQDSRIRLISRENKGLVATLNEGINLINTPLIARMDADDLCRPARFEKQMAYMAEHPECVALGTRVMLIDSEGCPIVEFADKIEHESIDAAHLAEQGGSIVHPSVVIRKNALASAGGYRPEFIHAEDLDLFLRLAEIGRLANLPDVLLDYRQHTNSIGYSHRQLQLESARHAVADAYNRRGLKYENNNETIAPSNQTVSEIYSKWAWWALKGGNIRTARKYALRVLLRSPFGINTYKLLACALRGH